MTTTPKFQQRDFEWIADVIAKFGTHMGPLGAVNMLPEQKESIARFICGELRETNDNFNPARFLRACGVGE